MTHNPHFNQRAWERYNFLPHKEDVVNIIKLIQEQKGTSVPEYRKSNRRTVWDIEYIGIKMRVVYNKKLKSLVTALPLPRKDSTSDRANAQR